MRPKRRALGGSSSSIPGREPRSGLVRSEKKGRVRTCRLEPKALATAETWIAEQRALWEGRLDRLEDYLEILKAKESDHE